MNETAIELSAKLHLLLVQRNLRVVFAESCTAGRVCGSLASIPGISQHMCGGFVVYRDLSKANWLGIELGLLEDPNVGPVSQPVSDELASAALRMTSEADVGIAVTGEVGPHAPAETDGKIFVSLKWRTEPRVRQCQFELASPVPTNSQDVAARVLRLDEATCCVLSFAVDQMRLGGPH